MAQYRYKARSLAGEEKTGVIAAESPQQVAALLRQDGFFLTKVEEEKPKAPFSLWARKPTLKDLASFSRQLSVMIQAGLPLTTSLSLAAEQAPNKLLARGLEQVLEEVEEGAALSAALASHPRLFPPLFVHLVEAAENGGTMDWVLSRLATYYEREYQLEKQLRSALMYPAIVSFLAVVVLAVVLFFILPQFGEIFASFGVDAPPMTEYILQLAAFLRSWWLVFALVALGFVLGFWGYLGTARGKTWWDNFSLRLPVVGEIINWTLSARFARTLAILARGGTPILLTLDITGKVVGNARFQEEIANCSSRVEQGENLASPFAESKLLPQLLIQMMRVGEETGSLDQMLERGADFFEAEVESRTKSITTLIEPAIVIFLGALVGFLLITIILPMYDLISGLNL